LLVKEKTKTTAKRKQSEDNTYFFTSSLKAIFGFSIKGFFDSFSLKLV
jgi:hypothetical protein